MDLGLVELSATFNNAFTLRDRVSELTAGARAIVAGWTESGTLVVVTHGANILPLTGVTPEEGGVMVIVKPDPASTAKLRTLRANLAFAIRTMTAEHGTASPPLATSRLRADPMPMLTQWSSDIAH